MNVPSGRASSLDIAGAAVLTVFVRRGGEDHGEAELGRYRGGRVRE
jgi:hypothetical protein